MQERSAARLDALLDAAAETVDEIGFARLTTGLVADRAGASIGTVYRYFPDRLVLLHALRNREVQRFRDLVVQKVHESPRDQVSDAVDCAIDAFVQMYKNEPGFRIIRFVGSESSGSVDEDSAEAGFFARQFIEIVSEEFGIRANRESVFRMEVVVETCNALVTRAFQANPDGDKRFIDEARAIARQYVQQHLDQGVASK